jgi:sugar/nucleoside kinase (ribokinase family)
LKNQGNSVKRIVVVGELNVDLVVTGLNTAPIFGQEILAANFEMTLGSASAIFACGVAKLGNDVTFISQVGHDDIGKFCLEALRQAGISTERVRQDANLKTGVTISLSTPDDRALVTFLGAIAELGIEHVPVTDFEGHSHLHATSYFLQHNLRPFFPTILRKAKRYGLTTSFDPNSDPTSDWKESIWEVISQTDILFLNEPESLRLTRRADVGDALRHLSEVLPCAVIKLGPKGAMATRNGETVFVEGFKLDAVDTTGAGDSFAAGFLQGFLEGQDLRACLVFGNACGALSTLKAGGTTNQPTREQLADFLQTRNG